MLCDACKGIDLVNALTQHLPHHGSYREIRLAAAEGCELCQLIAATTPQNRDWDAVEVEMKNTHIEYYLYGGSGDDSKWPGPDSLLFFTHPFDYMDDDAIRFIASLRVFVYDGMRAKCRSLFTN